MSENNLIFAFDLGSGSMGVCVRKGEKILYLESLLIDPEFASVKKCFTTPQANKDKNCPQKKRRVVDRKSKRGRNRSIIHVPAYKRKSKSQA